VWEWEGEVIGSRPPATSLRLQIKQLYGGLPKRGGRFYDIGSGTGKPVFVAALAHPWDSCVGEGTRCVRAVIDGLSPHCQPRTRHRN